MSPKNERIGLTYAALNFLNVFAADARNIYLHPPPSQKDDIICSPEFGLENVGKCFLIHRSLDGGKSTGRDFKNQLRLCMKHLDFVSFPTDADIWMRFSKSNSGSQYYEYIILYTDDALVISENRELTLRTDLGHYFELKEIPICPPPPQRSA